MKKILLLSLILIIILLVIYFIYKNMMTDMPLFINTYYKYLIKEDTSNSKIIFIERKNYKEPILILKRTKNTHDYTNIFYIENNKVKAISDDTKSSLLFLYNLEENNYDYYLSKSNGSIYYEKINNIIKQGKIDIETFDYNIKEEEIGNYFIDIDLEYTKVSNLSSSIKEAWSKYKTINEIISDDKILEQINNKIDDNNFNIETKKEQEIEELYSKIEGLWYDKLGSQISIFSTDDKVHHFTNGWLASEVEIDGYIDITKKINEYLYELKVGNVKLSMDTTNLDNQELMINNTTFKFIDKDVDKAYDKLLNN